MTENGKVTIVPDENGSVIRVSKNNPEFGHVRLTQEKVAFGAQGWVNRKVRSTLIHGTVEDLQSLSFFAGQEVDGKIQIRESLKPFNERNPERDLKKAGETGIICTQAGSPIYRKTVYDMSGSKKDAFEQHDNVEELRAAYEASKVQSAMKPNDEFSIGG